MVEIRSKWQHSTSVDVSTFLKPSSGIKFILLSFREPLITCSLPNCNFSDLRLKFLSSYPHAQKKFEYHTKKPLLIIPCQSCSNVICLQNQRNSVFLYQHFDFFKVILRHKMFNYLPVNTLLFILSQSWSKTMIDCKIEEIVSPLSI